jgi:hypothetical protein
MAADERAGEEHGSSDRDPHQRCHPVGRLFGCGDRRRSRAVIDRSADANAAAVTAIGMKHGEWLSTRHADARSLT